MIMGTLPMQLILKQKVKSVEVVDINILQNM